MNAPRRVRQCEHRAKLNLLDEGVRICVEEALIDDRLTDIAALKSAFPLVDQVGFRAAVA